MHISTRRITAHTIYPFRIARLGASVDGSDVRRIVVSIEHDGIVGIGEAAPAPYYKQSLDAVENVVQQIQDEPNLIGDDPFLIQSIVDRLLERFGDHRSAVAAIDAALHDWIGKKLGQPVWRLLGLDASRMKHTSMTIGIGSVDEMTERIEATREFRSLKIKVGSDHDRETLDLVRKIAPNATIRTDANASWTPDIAIERIRALADFPLELVEQPIPAGDLTSLQRIHESSPVPIYADEDCVTCDDILKLVGKVTGVNIKLAKCGGIREAIRMIHVARAHGLKIMLGCMAETSLGVGSALQIASLADVVDLDGHLLLADDPFTGLLRDGDRVLPSDRPGLGVEEVAA